MTTVIVVLAIIAGLIVGALLLGAGMFFWYLLRVVRGLNETVGQFIEAIEPLIRTGALASLAGSAENISSIAGQVLSAMKNINITVAAFNSAFFNQEALKTTADHGAGGFAAPADSAGFSYTEEEAARSEVQETLRRQGIETDERRVKVPPLSETKGAQV